MSSSEVQEESKWGWNNQSYSYKSEELFKGPKKEQNEIIQGSCNNSGKKN